MKTPWALIAAAITAMAVMLGAVGTSARIDTAAPVRAFQPTK